MSHAASLIGMWTPTPRPGSHALLEGRICLLLTGPNAWIDRCLNYGFDDGSPHWKLKDDELLLPWFANPTLHLHRARQLLGMNFFHGLSSVWELITPFILQAPGASDGSSEIVSVEFCLLLALISSARLKGT